MRRRTPRLTRTYTPVPYTTLFRSCVFQRFSGFLIDDAHRQANLAARVDLEDLDLDFLAFGQDVGHLLDALVGDFADVDQTVLAAHEIHERPEIDEIDDLAVIEDRQNTRLNSSH